MDRYRGISDNATIMNQIALLLSTSLVKLDDYFVVREVNVESTVKVKQQESIIDEGAIEGKLKIQCAPHADDIEVAYLSFQEVINHLMQEP